MFSFYIIYQFFVFYCRYIISFIVAGTFNENRKNIKKDNIMSKRGIITNIQDTTVAPASHNLFNNHVQNKIKTI